MKALDFFAGSGLVRLGLEPHFQTAWANDNCPKKAAVYRANYATADEFHLADIEHVNGKTLPSADLAWASFPCQDLSLAGKLTGMKAGTRSGLFWQWLRVMDEMSNRPAVLVAENVVGFVVAGDGRHFTTAYAALRERGYRAGALVVDASLFVPQSRPRAFLVAADERIDLSGLTQHEPSPQFHPPGLVRTAQILDDPEWVWWALPTPPPRRKRFSDVCDYDAPCDESAKALRLRSMLSPLHRDKLNELRRSGMQTAGTGYKRARPDDNGRLRQRLELRFDGVAGCLRTPEGGSSRQIVVLVKDKTISTRLMTARECARLMGAPETYLLPGTYNDAYRAMGDAVVVPVTRWIAERLLAPLCNRAAGILQRI